MYTIDNDKILWQNLLENKKKMNLKKWVKNIKTTGYNGVRTVYEIAISIF